MEESHRKVLNKWRLKISRNINVRKVTEELFSEGILDENDLEEILSQTTIQYKALRLSDLLLRRGSQAFPVFMQALRGSGCGSIANAIQLELGEEPAGESNERRPRSVGLPGKVAKFVGRMDVCEEIIPLLETDQGDDVTCLVTIVAPPGFGKTAVATHLGYRMVEEGKDVLYFSLRNVQRLNLAAEHMLEKLVGVHAGENPVKQLTSYLSSLPHQTVLILDNAEDLQIGDGSNFEDFLDEIGQHASNVVTIITSRNAVSKLDVFPFRTKHIPLKPLTGVNSAAYLKNDVPVISDRLVRAFAKACRGVPLLLTITGSFLKKKTIDPVDLLRKLQNCPHSFLKAKDAKIQELYSLLRVFYNNLGADMKGYLAYLACFPTSFTKEEAKDVLFPNEDFFDFQLVLDNLVRHSLVQQDEDQDKWHYSLHPLVQAFCKSSRKDTCTGYNTAIRRFSNHYLSLLQQLNDDFISTDYKTVIDKYCERKANISHAILASTEDDDINLKQFGLCVSIEAVIFLAKVMKQDEFISLYSQCLQVAEGMSDKTLYSECLVSIGFKQLWYYNGYKDAYHTDAKRSLQEAHDLQTHLVNYDSECQGHCKCKLGLCYFVAGDRKKGISLIAQGIGMLKRFVRSEGSGKMERMLLAGGFCDLAMAMFTSGEYKAAVNIWTNLCLVRYREVLDTHPFTVSLLDYIGDAYQKLGDPKRAVAFKKESLAMRKSLLDLDIGLHNPRLLKIVPYEGSNTAKVLEIGQKSSTTAEKNESGKDFTMATSTFNKNQSKVEGIMNHEGGILFAENVQVIFPNGAISKLEDDVVLKIFLEKPSAHCDMIVKNGLENDVMFIAPVLNLQPSGHVFKKPVTLQIKLSTGTDAFRPSDILVLHGTQATDGKIVWEDITDQSTIDLEKKELKVQIFGFSLIATLLRLTSIFAKDVINRLNHLGFYYTMSVLFKNNHPHSPLGELALVFMSHDVFHETRYREHPSSVLMQLKRNEYETLRTIDRTESKRIYNNETLKVSLLLGQDYEPTHGQLESNFEVDSSVWWSTGHVLKWSLKGTDGVRILCGKIGIEGQHGHILWETFCELDTYEYVRELLKVGEGGTSNLVPFARELGVEKEEVIKVWLNDEGQLERILQHWLKQQEEECCMDAPAILRNTIQGLNSEEFGVDERGKMHINHLRELAFKVKSLNHNDPDLMEYFSDEITTLCNCILKDCCIELDAEVSVGNYPRFLFFHQQVSDDVALRLQTICSSSTRSINEDFFSIAPFLVQAIKDIFRTEKNQSIVQNGLKGLPDESVSQFESNVRDAFREKDILKLVYEVCGVLASLCLNNCKKYSTEEIENWCESLAIWQMCEFLREFFQSRQDRKLHKRLKLFSRSLRRITQDVSKIKEIEMRHFYDVSLNLITFATFDASKLVRFEITDSANSPVTCYSEDIKYDRPHDKFSQQFEFRKETEGELRLRVIAHVHLDGKICKVGAYESVFMVPTLSKEKLANCAKFSLPVAVKTELTDSGDLRVVLSSTRRKTISEALCVLQRELGDDIVDSGQISTTESHLTVCCFVEAVRMVRLRLQYKWRSEAISVESNDFVAVGDSSSLVASTSASDSVTNSSSPVEAELAALSIASHPGDNVGNFGMDPSGFEIIKTHARQQCGRLEYHLHQTIQKGQVCVAGNGTTLRMEMPAQSFLQAGICAPSQQSITAGPSSNEGEVSEP